jgi:hypothetical protein
LLARILTEGALNVRLWPKHFRSTKTFKATLGGLTGRPTLPHPQANHHSTC